MINLVLVVIIAVAFVYRSKIKWIFIGIKSFIDYLWMELLTRLDTAKLSSNSKYLTILYQYGGIKYLIHVPFSTKLRPRALNNPVHVYTSSGTDIRAVTRTTLARCHPCVPILVTPKMLDAEYITIGSSRFTGDQVPNFDNVD